jgi:signal transduction histidine kinase
VARVDPLRIEQVLINLLDNAIKYSPEGGAILIELSADAQQKVRLVVTDHGIGIPAEYREQIFNRFYQAHKDSQIGGMGLGLYISRQIIELHGGQIQLECPPDGGTQFLVQIPIGIEG